MSTDHNRRATGPPHKRKRYLWPLALIGRILGMLIMVCVITGCIVACVMTVYVLNTLDSTDSIVLENVELSYTTILYAKDLSTGQDLELQRLDTASAESIWIDYDHISQCVKDAAVAVEDKRFWNHSGIDFKRTFSAALNYINPFRSDRFGGSTITQQVVKNVTGDKDSRIDRKLREIFRAINLEKNYSKEQILEAYLNIASFSGNKKGIQSAAYLFFGKDAVDLTPAEAASIIATTQNPWKYNPFSFPENNRERQLMILGLMREQKHLDGTPMLTEEQYQTAVAQEMVFKTEQYEQRTERIQDWFVDTVYEEVKNDLMSVAGYTEAGASDAMRNGGFRIYTTVDTEMQTYLEQKYTTSETFPKIRNDVYPESAFVVLDQYTGEIKAIVGSNREKTGSRLFNRATDAVRHPGSTIKPLASYSLAFEYDYIRWSTVMEDSPILLNEKDPTSVYPKNFYTNPPYRGPITVTEAIQRSTNTIPVKLVQLLSPRTSFNFMKDQLGFKNLVESKTIGGKVYSDVDLAPMALGAMTGGVTPLEMAGAYQMFGNGGYYYKPHSYTRVLDAEGNVILENKTLPQRVLTPETATIMNKLMQRVTNAAPGTGTPAKFSDMPIAGKTGTSDQDYNQWFIGVTPYYVGVCWLGYDEMATINYSGYSYPPPIIWKNVMGPIHSKLAVKGFETMGNVVERTYCLETGNLAGPLCPTTAVGWYKLSNEPPVCDAHKPKEEAVTPSGPEGDMDYWDWLYGGEGLASDTDDED